jgi:hypothetical protein
MPPDKVRVTWWWTHDELVSSYIGLEALPPLSNARHKNLQLCNLKEVTERVLSASVHQPVNVIDIAFVFHADMFETEFLDCAIMARVFYTRCCFNAEDKLCLVDCRRFKPFNSSLCKSYASSIWWSGLDLKEYVSKLLNDPKQYQICKKIAKCEVFIGERELYC